MIAHSYCYYSVYSLISQPLKRNFLQKGGKSLKTVGIICEYNPIHLGHARQLRWIRQTLGEETAIVCAMSGNFVQRGAPAIVDKSLRAEAAVRCGADLVVELPLPVCLSSAEGFAAGGVAMLSRLCQSLCFGTETAQADQLLRTAQALLSPEFSQHLRQALDTGISFPAARQQALEALGVPNFAQPNDILAVEYAKAILTQDSPMELLPLHRPGSYHAQTIQPDAPSATALRLRMEAGQNWQEFLPEAAASILEDAPLHTLAAGERAMLARLRSMTEADFAALPYGSEGLWRRLYHACRRESSLEDILTAVKSKRYTRTRLDRMVMCAFLGLSLTDMEQPIPYARVLSCSSRGRTLLASVRKSGFFQNPGVDTHHPYWDMEQRCQDLYDLFQCSGIPPAGAEKRRRIRCLP